MEVNRREPQGGVDVAIRRIAFCLDQQEKARSLAGGLRWESLVTPRLTLEELVGALVAAEQALAEPGETSGPARSE